ncbi:hypothetical protein [Ilumatobacter sp.]|uniref:hypothetical protein n=1 Tax=Ilumatobacter sp. TaxID=1967498 RepID=UPI003B518041
MTEIPEHLLKRSRERRSAIGKGGDGGSDDAPTTTEASSDAPATTSGGGSATPAETGPSGPPTRAAAPQPEAPKPPKPDPIYVSAAKSRRKVPWWAMATLGLMPVWGFMYVRAVTEAPEVVEGPLGVGAEVYGSCASCHGANGGGGVGRQFSGGEVLDTFPVIQDQLRFTYWGTQGYNLAGVSVYGDPDRPGGAHEAGSFGVMPQQGSEAGGDLADEEILGVICHERYSLGGADPDDEEWAEEFELWCSEESPIFELVESGEFTLVSDEPVTVENADGDEVTVEPVGPEPIEGSAGSGS